MSDAEIVARAYDRAFVAPPGFYRDPALTGATTLVVVGDPAKDSVASRRSNALALVKAAIATSNVPQLGAKPDEERETERSFDFRVGTYWWRVHKASYFDWNESTQYPAPSRDSGTAQTVGTFRKRPITESAARKFAEYHQTITGRIAGGSKILAVTGKATPKGWEVVIHEAMLSSPNVSQLTFDTVEVWENTYTFDKDTGVVTKLRAHAASVRAHDRPIPKPGEVVPP